MERPKITISILTYNRHALLDNLLNQLGGLNYRPLELIVVDNHSEDQTQQIIQRHSANIIYIRLEKNLGAVARNYGLRRATGEIIVTLDDDVFGINDIALDELASIFENNANMGAVNFKISDPQGKTCNWVHHCRMEENVEKAFKTYEITEGAVAFRNSALKKSGYYADCFFLSHEGPDLAFRIMDVGFDVTYSNKVAVTHLHSELGRKSWYNYYYDTRNHIWLSVRNFPFPYSIFWMLRGVLPMLLYSIRDGYGWHWTRAVHDGIKNVRAAAAGGKKLREQTIMAIKNIDKKRPPVLSLLRMKLGKKGVRL